MKRVGNLIDKIADPDNLRLAFWKARKGKEGKKEVALFRQYLDKNLLILREQILSANVDVGNYNYFKIFDPKERQICAASFHERVLHHAIMNICHPIFERYQIFDSYACRKGKGTYAALERAAVFQKKYRYFLKLDVRKYFDTINHDVLKTTIARFFKDKKLLSVLIKIIDSYETTQNKGLPIGNLTSQYFANHILAKADHFAKESLRVKGYVRYMDDMVLWDNNKSNLLKNGKQFELFINKELNQQLKPFCLNSVERGLPFLGYLLFPNYIKLASRSRKRFTKKINQYFMNLEKGIWSQTNFQQSCLPLLAFVNHAQSRGFRKNIFDKIEGQFPWVRIA